MSFSEKYRQLLDSQTIDFINRTEACYPADAVTASIPRQRELYNEMCTQFAAPPPATVSWGDTQCVSAAGVSVGVRCYASASDDLALARLQRLITESPSANSPTQNASETAVPIVLYMHGGGFIVGGLESHHDVCAEICHLSGYELISVDYRLAPEHVHPAALDDVLSVISQLAKSGSRIILCGDSAGANLAAAASLVCRDKQALCEVISGQVLIYPGLGGHHLLELTSQVDTMLARVGIEKVSSYIEHSHAPMLSLEEVEFYDAVRWPLAEKQSPGGVLETASEKVSKKVSETATALPPDRVSDVAPIVASDFSSLPKTICFSAQCDPLHDDGEMYCRKLVSANVNARFVSEQGLVHGYLRARHSVDRARDSFASIIAALIECG